jgi:hypothetical protein
MRTRVLGGVEAGISRFPASRLGASFNVEFLVHGKPAEVCTPAFNAFLGIHMKALAVEKGAGSKTGVRKDSQAAF